MALKLSSLKSSVSVLPDRFMVHGAEGMGKTTLAAEFPNPIYLPTQGERTPAGVEMATPGLVTDLDDVRAFIGDLVNDEHDFGTLVVDSVDGLERLVWAETCAANGWADIEKAGFGKGYVAADAGWRDLLDGFDAVREQRKMAVVLIAHTGTVTVDEPGFPSFARYELKLQKRGRAMLMEWVDHCFFVAGSIEVKEPEKDSLKKTTHAKGGGTRFIHTDARPYFAAKNRGDGMPAKIPFTRGKGYSEISKYLGNTSGAEAA